MLAGLVNFDRALGELYVELAPHPRGWDYLRFEAVLCIIFVSAHVLGVVAALGIGRSREMLQCPAYD